MRLIDLFDCFLLDLDGVVYIGDSPVPGSVEAIRHLLDENKTVIFLTNNPRHTVTDYASKLRGMGIEATPLEIITSSTALANHIKSEFSDLLGKNAFVIGSQALKDEIRAIGLELVSGEDGKKADFLIFGGHPDFHYDEMKIASIALANGAHFYATNRDAAYPTAEGHIPATGAMLASIEVASGRQAICAGKPEPIIFDIALENFDRNRDRVAIVGDHIDTDIIGGKKAGISTILVLSGSTNKEDIVNLINNPDYVIGKLSDLMNDAL